MRLAVRRGRPGAVLALAVLCAHGLALQVLSTRPPPAPATFAAPGLQVHPVELARVPAPAAETPSATPRRATGALPAAGEAMPPTEPAANAPARIAAPMRLRYEVSGHTRERPVTGQAELSWQHDGQRYEARLDLDGEGLARRHQRSVGQVTPQGLVPQRYSERTRHEEAVHFERDAGHAVFSANRPPAPLQADAQDRLSLLLQLGARIAARPQAYPVGAYLEIQTATTREALIWRFQVEGAEELPLPGGQQITLRLVRKPTGEFEPWIEVWLAPGLDYAPVRMRLTQHTGDRLDYRWSGTDRP